MTNEQKDDYEALLRDGRGCEAAYFAAYEAGECTMGADDESAIGRAALLGLRHAAAGQPYSYSYRDCCSRLA